MVMQSDSKHKKARKRLLTGRMDGYVMMWQNHGHTFQLFSI